MGADLRTIITSTDPAVRDLSLDACCRKAGLDTLLRECADLDAFRRRSDNLYERVRALFFLYALHRFHLPRRLGDAAGLIPFEGYDYLLRRRFEEAIDVFLGVMGRRGPSDAVSSALSSAYHSLGFQTLADQVRRSVRSVRGNQWMFRVGHPADQPLRIRKELLERPSADVPFPVLCERTPVRMDLSHSAWSDIFFLGMDYPEGARVLNVSIDLAVRGRDRKPRPPVETFIRVIDEPVLRLGSVDLGAWAEITQLRDVFDFAMDYLGLLKAGIIAAGIVPAGMEGSQEDLAGLLARMVGPGLGLEIVSYVHNIPKGSRLAVSTSLLASLIAVCMRATRQAESLSGPLREGARRIVAARAILGEWLGGSGGGWQDSGGLWPGMKLIEGALAEEGDPEYGISRGRLLPRHTILDLQAAPAETRRKLQDSLVLVHGGLAQNVGPILEMVTEKYLLRSEAEWQGRRQAVAIMADILAALRTGDVPAIGEATTRNFFGPIQTIIPWASNLYTETLIDQVRARFGDDFQGFWMLGGMSGGGMGFIFAPERKTEAQACLEETMNAAKRRLQHAMPFAMEPVVYDFAINDDGTLAEFMPGESALLPPGYYAQMAPQWLRADPRSLTAIKREELERFGAACRTEDEFAGMADVIFDRLVPRKDDDEGGERDLRGLLDECGFDRELHEQTRADLRAGRIGLAQNRLPATSVIQDVQEGDVVDAASGLDAEHEAAGRAALAGGEVGVVTLAAGVGSRWTQGAGVVKALHPFCRLSGKHRTFIEVHLAKTRRVSRECGVPLPHVITLSHLTQKPIEEFLAEHDSYGYDGPLYLSPGRAVGLRLVPMVRDLRFAWEEMPQQLLDEQAQKVQDGLRATLIKWARAAGEGADYTDNVSMQCLHPVGHWYEVPNLIRNGVLARLLAERPSLKYLMLHNIDTLGADVDPPLLGLHIRSGSALTYEVIGRRIEDRGGGLARVGGRVRLVEGLAMPREEDEFALSYYNSMTTWITIDRLLDLFGLAREDLTDEAKTAPAIRKLGARIPTYITIKDVKKRWGHGQEDIYPVAQFEKLWGDMSSLPEAACGFVVVPRLRGQQLKEQAQLDAWLRDGSAAHVEKLCAWE